MFGWNDLERKERKGRDLEGNDFLCLDNNLMNEGFGRKGNGGTNVLNFVNNQIFPIG